MIWPKAIRTLFSTDFAVSSRRRTRSRRTGLTTRADILELRQMLSASHDLIGLTALRQDPVFTGIDGSGVSVVVIDSGLDTTHPDIVGNYLTGRDIAGGLPTPTITDAHGTHVAGIIGSTNPEIGVATDVNIIALNVGTLNPFGDIFIDDTDLEAALRWTLEHRLEYNIVAVNMSLGNGFYSNATQASGSSLLDEIRELQTSGVAVVSVAGNEFGDVLVYGLNQTATNSPGVISTFNVGAVYEETEFVRDNDDNLILDGNGNPIPIPWEDRAAGVVDRSQRLVGYVYSETSGADQIAEFSQRGAPGASATIFAPGAYIRSTVPGGYDSLKGTSMAAPMVSGAVALVQEAALQFGGRLLSVTELRSVILSTADRILDGDDEDVQVVRAGQEDSSYGGTGNMYSRVNVYNAVKAVRAMFAPRQDANGILEQAVTGPLLKPANIGALSPIGRILAKQYGETIIDAEIGRDSFIKAGTGGRVTESWDVTASDVDVYRFVVTSAGSLKVLTRSNSVTPNDFDTYLRLFDAQGTQIAFANDGGFMKFSQLNINVQPGTYYAAVSGAGNETYDVSTLQGRSNGATGTYQILFELSNATGDGDDTPETAQNLGEMLPGTWTSAGTGVSTGFLPLETHDYYQFEVLDQLTATWTAQTLTFNGSSALRYPELELLDSSLVSLGKDVGGSNDLIASLTRTLGPGTYFLKVHGHKHDILANRNYCSYKLSFAGTSIDTDGTLSGADAAGMTSVSPGQTIASELSRWLGTDAASLPTNPVSKDVDLQKIRALDTGVLRVSTSSMGSNSIAQADKVPTAITIFDEGGQIIAQDIPFGDAVDPEIRVPINAGQIVYVGISHRSNTGYSPLQHASGSASGTGRYLYSVQLETSTGGNSQKDDTTGATAVRTIGVGDSVADAVGRDGSLVRDSADVDLFRFEPANTAAIRIRLQSGNVPTNLRLFRSTNGALTQVATDVAAGYSVSEIVMNAEAGAVYFIGVNGMSSNPDAYNPATGAGAVAGTVGPYGLKVTAIQIPGTVVVTSPPAQTGDTTPTITWNADASSTSYHVRISRQSTGIVAGEAFNVAGTSWTVPAALTNGDYVVVVRGQSNSGDFGPWSSGRTFNVTAAPVPGVPVVVSPSGSVATRKPEFTWENASSADVYDLWVDQIGGTQQIIRERAIRGLSFTAVADLSAGQYRFWVRATNVNGVSSAWSAMKTFTIVNSIPGLITVTAPGDVVATGQPVFRWLSDVASATYDLWVDQVGGRSQIIREAALTGTSYTPTTNLTPGFYRMWIRGKNGIGQPGNWSVMREFEISSRTVPVGSGPAGLTTDRQPTFRWKGVANALYYDLWVNQIGGVAQILRDQRVTGVSLTSMTQLPVGNYRYWVRAFLSEGVAGAWSAPADFVIASAAPKLLGPAGNTVSGKPVFSWEDTGVAGVYDLWVDGPSGQSQVIRQKSLTGTTYTPTQTLGKGTYRAWIRLISSAGVISNWSPGVVFTVADAHAPVGAVRTDLLPDRLATIWVALSCDESDETDQDWATQVVIQDPPFPADESLEQPAMDFPVQLIRDTRSMPESLMLHHDTAASVQSAGAVVTKITEQVLDQWFGDPASLS